LSARAWVRGLGSKNEKDGQREKGIRDERVDIPSTCLLSESIEVKEWSLGASTNSNRTGHAGGGEHKGGGVDLLLVGSVRCYEQTEKNTVRRKSVSADGGNVKRCFREKGTPVG